MTATELLDAWEFGDKEVLAASVINSHPNIIIDFANLLFMKYGPMAVVELKAYINEEFAC